MHLVIVLLLSGGARAGWARRTGAPEELPGVAVSTAELADSVKGRAEADARRSTPLGPDERLDPNRVSADELDRLPGVGPGTARALAQARDTLPFASPDDLLRVRGIGPRTLERLLPHLEFSSPPAEARRPGPGNKTAAAPGVNVNRADSDALQALPGVGPVLARRIVDFRAGGARFQVPEDLLLIPGIGPVLLDRIRPRLRF